MAIGCSRPQLLRSFHPERILFLELRQILRKCLWFVVRRKQRNHLEEEGRLRSGQIVSAIAVRDVSIGVNEKNKITDHVPNKIVVATLAEPQHGEVAVPILELAKTR